MANFTPVGVELIVKGADKFNSTLGKASGSIAGFGKAAVKAAAVGAAAVGAAAIGIGAASVKMAVSWESAFAGVKKTVDTTEDELGELEQSLRDLAKETPVDVEDLAAIAELGGQLGIVDDTTEDVSGTLKEFTKTIAAMGVATNLTTEEAAVGFAQIANVMGTSSDQVSNMGSSVVALGNTLATNERDIVSFAQRIAGTGAVAGLTESDIFGISAAFSSVGIQAQAGGTAVSKVFLDMNNAAIEGGDQMEIFAAVAGIEAEHFGKAWEKDAGGVFGEFVKGLGLAGDDAVAILDELEIKDSQAIRAFLSLAGAGDLVTEALERSEDAFFENTALAAEAEQRYKTTESQFKIFKNTLKDIGITIGQALLPALNKVVKFGQGFLRYIQEVIVEGDTLNDFLADFPKGVRPFIKGIGEAIKWIKEKLLPAIGNLIKWIGKNLPKAIKILSRFWKRSLQPILKNFGRFIKREIIPAAKRIVEWFRDNIPRAIETLKRVIATLAKFWEDTLLPAIKAVIKFVQDNLVPILAGIAVLILTVVIPAVAAWAAANVAAALATLAAWAPIIAVALAIVAVVALLVKAWQRDWGGIQTKTKEVWENTLKPAFEAIREWLEVNIPKAIETVKKFWENTFKPALEAVGKFIVDEVIPIIEDLVSWLEENIPKAIKTVETFWNDTLKPALKAIWEFIKDPVIVWIGKLVAWLQENIPTAMEAVKNFWEETLRPALQDIRDFIEDPLLVKIRELVEWVGEKIEAAWQALKDWWDNTGKDFVQGIVDWIEDPLIVKIKELIEWIGEKIQAGFEVLKKWWDENGRVIIERISGGIGKIVGVVEALIKRINDAIEAFKRLLGMGEPTGPPTSGGGGGGFGGPEDEGAVGGSSLVGGHSVTAPASSMGAAAHAGSTIAINFHSTISSEMDMVTFEQRVKRVVTDAVGA